MNRCWIVEGISECKCAAMHPKWIACSSKFGSSAITGINNRLSFIYINIYLPIFQLLSATIGPSTAAAGLEKSYLSRSHAGHNLSLRQIIRTVCNQNSFILSQSWSCLTKCHEKTNIIFLIFYKLTFWVDMKYIQSYLVSIIRKCYDATYRQIYEGHVRKCFEANF